MVVVNIYRGARSIIQRALGLSISSWLWYVISLHQLIIWIYVLIHVAPYLLLLYCNIIVLFNL